VTSSQSNDKPAIPSRILLGPGPSDVAPEVLTAMSRPLLGHLDPEFLDVMNDTMGLLRRVFETDNELTVPMSGTGSAGMETCFVNIVEPGDRVIVGVAGVFGERMADVADRCGAEVVPVEAEWGRIIEPDAIEAALKQGRTKMVGVVLAETSTGARQPLDDISRLCREHDALLCVDAVTALGGLPVAVDAVGIDVCYSGTQKCLSCPPGLSPVTLGERARRALGDRRTKVQSWYLDLTMIQRYWGSERFYHHTAPVSMIFGLQRALRLVVDEGLPARFARHSVNGRACLAGLEVLGFAPVAQEGHRLPMLLSVRLPESVEDLPLRRHLLQHYGIEVGGGLGPFKGRIWRVGLMGHSSTRRNVMLLLAAVGEGLRRFGVKVDPGAGVGAAQAVYEGAQAD